MVRSILVGLAFVVSFLSSHAQGIVAVAEADTHKALIGDVVTITLRVQHPKDFMVILPSKIKEGKIEVIDSLTIDTTKKQESISYKQVFKVSAYDSGAFYFPALSVFFKQGTTQKELLTDSILIAFSSVPVDTTQEIKAIKPPLDIPTQWDDFIEEMIWGGVILLALAVLYFLWKRYKNKKKSEVSTPVILLNPFEEAYQRLKKAEADKLWQEGKLKEYYSEISDALRGYITRIYQIDALEFTTSQTLKALNRKLETEEKNILKEVLELSDLVKFAKYHTLPEENEQVLQDAFKWLSSVERREQKKRVQENNS